MGAGGSILPGRQLLWPAEGTSRCKREAGRDHSTRYLPSGVLNPSKWGHRSQAKTLPGQAIPRLQSSAAGDFERHHTMTLFLFPSILTIMTHTLDSPERYQASKLFSSPPSWVFRELLGNGGGGFLGTDPLQRPGAWHCKLSFL